MLHQQLVCQMSTSSIMTATMSTLTGDSNSNNTIAHEQGGQAQESAMKARSMKTNKAKELKDIIEEASAKSRCFKERKTQT